MKALTFSDKIEHLILQFPSIVLVLLVYRLLPVWLFTIWIRSHHSHQPPRTAGSCLQQGGEKSPDKPTVLTCPASNTRPTAAGELRAKPITWPYYLIADISLLVYVAVDMRN